MGLLCALVGAVIGIEKGDKGLVLMGKGTRKKCRRQEKKDSPEKKGRGGQRKGKGNFLNDTSRKRGRKAKIKETLKVSNGRQKLFHEAGQLVIKVKRVEVQRPFLGPSILKKKGGGGTILGGEFHHRGREKAEDHRAASVTQRIHKKESRVVSIKRRPHSCGALSPISADVKKRAQQRWLKKKPISSQERQEGSEEERIYCFKTAKKRAVQESETVETESGGRGALKETRKKKSPP